MDPMLDTGAISISKKGTLGIYLSHTWSKRILLCISIVWDNNSSTDLSLLGIEYLFPYGSQRSNIGCFAGCRILNGAMHRYKEYELL